jgi:hypothetical protein
LANIQPEVRKLTTPQQKLKAEVLHKDLEAYRKLETWGLSLFLGAIGLLTKQLLEWEHAAEAESATKVLTRLPDWVHATPLIIGLAAFIFLRLVNYRSTPVGQEFRRMVGQRFPKERPGWGELAIFMSVMPLGLGFGASLLLGAWGQVAFEVTELAAVLLVVPALLIHICARRAMRAENG